MKLQALYLGLAAVFTASLSAQPSIAITDITNSVISPNSVVNDSVVVSIAQAASNALVTLTYTYNGGTQQVWNAGYTGDGGDWDLGSTSPASQIGVWVEQWAVGGINVGPLFNFEIFDIPTSLNVVSVAASSPDSCGSNYCSRPGNCLIPANTYGPSASIQWQIYGASGNETVPSSGLGIMLLPTETGTDYNVSGGVVNTWGPNNIGSDNTSFPWHPPSAQYATSSGFFYDVPVATCTSTSFTTFKSQQQIVSIKIGGKSYPVRTQNWYAGSSSSGHGVLYNNIDVNLTQ